MQIWPAIDLRDGKCVRLEQGDYNRETIFSEDPVAMARHWVSLGAKQLHLVDLDGARSGHSANLGPVGRIVESAGVPCQLGGGIRTDDNLRRLFDIGVERLVVGTQAVREPEWFRRACGNFPGKLVLGIDARRGRVATDGWLDTSEVAATDLAKQFAGLPLAAIVYTDIETDGMLAGPNFEAMRQMQQAVECDVVASGGVTSVADVAQLATLGVAGCIIGRALYEGRLDLKAALQAAQGSADQGINHSRANG